MAILGHSVRTALTVAIGLAQIGEFSFILSELARYHGLMPDAGHNVLVASAIISITINPLLFRSLPKIEDWLKKRPTLWRLLNGTLSEEDLSAYCKLHLTNYKRPKYIEFRDDLPKSNVGKILRRELRASN